MKRNKSASILASHSTNILRIEPEENSDDQNRNSHQPSTPLTPHQPHSPLSRLHSNSHNISHVYSTPQQQSHHHPNSPGVDSIPAHIFNPYITSYPSGVTDPASLLHAYQRVLNHLHSLQRRLDSLEHHIHGIANESSHLKYSRRLLQVSNIVLALYIGLRTLRLFWIKNAKGLIWSFWSEYALSVGTKKYQKEGIIRAFLRRRAKAALQNAASDSPMKKYSLRSVQILIVTWFGPAIIRIILLVFSTYWLQKMEIWKRRVGVWISFISNVHVAVTTDVSPWTIYFNIFTLLTYITTRNYQHMIPQKIDRYVDYGIRSLTTPTRRFIHHQRQKSSPGKMQDRKDGGSRSSLTSTKDQNGREAAPNGTTSQDASAAPRENNLTMRSRSNSSANGNKPNGDSSKSSNGNGTRHDQRP